MHYLYTILNKKNNNIYVGITNNPKKRWGEHRTAAKNENYTKPLYQSIRKHGINNFTFSIVAEHDNRQIISNGEKCLIKYLKKYEFILYNLNEGGDNIVIRRSGKDNPFFGKKHTEETKKIISEKATGRKMPPLTAEHKQAISDWNLKNRPPLSEETRVKLKEAAQRNKVKFQILTMEQAKEIRASYSRQLRNGEILAKEYGVSGNVIMRIVKGLTYIE